MAASTPGPFFLLPHTSVAVTVTVDDSVVDADALAIVALQGFEGFGIVAPALDSRVLIPPVGSTGSDGRVLAGQDQLKAMTTDFYCNMLSGADKKGFPVLHFVLLPASGHQMSSFIMETVVKAMLDFESSREGVAPCVLRQVFLIVKDQTHRNKLLDTFDTLAPTIQKYDGAHAKVSQQNPSPLSVSDVQGARPSSLSFQFTDSESVARGEPTFAEFNNGGFENQGDPKWRTVTDRLYEPIATVSFRGVVPLGCLSPVEGLLQFGHFAQLSPHFQPVSKWLNILEGGFILPWESWHPPGRGVDVQQTGQTSGNVPPDLGACIDGVLPRFAFLCDGDQIPLSYYILRDVVNSRRELPSILLSFYRQDVPAWEQNEDSADRVTTAVTDPVPHGYRHQFRLPLTMTIKRCRPAYSAEHGGKSCRVDGNGGNEEDTGILYEVKQTSTRVTATNEQQEDMDKCPVCHGDTNDQEPRRLKMCGHIFCRRCLEQNFRFRLTCPLCCSVIAVKHGVMPQGTMTVFGLCTFLPGCADHTTMAIQYFLPPGVQQACHPNPGHPYSGTTRLAFLPAYPEGLQVCRLLWVAFQCRLTFTVGRSMTFGQDNMVTWNDIHHKTSMDGGPTW